MSRNPFLIGFCTLLLFSAFKAKNQEGQFKTYYPSGAVKAEFPLKNGRLEGETTWYYESGAIGAILDYKDNRLHGTARAFYEDGKLKKVAQHANNIPVGISKLYHPDGSLMREDVYKEGSIVHRRYYDGSGLINYCEEAGVDEPGGAETDGIF